MDSYHAEQQWNWIRWANYFGTAPTDWVHGYLCFNPGAWIWPKGCDVYMHIVSSPGNVFFKFSQNTCPWVAFACFCRDTFLLLLPFGWFCWAYTGMYIFRGSNISCRLGGLETGWSISVRAENHWTETPEVKEIRTRQPDRRSVCLPGFGPRHNNNGRWLKWHSFFFTLPLSSSHWLFFLQSTCAAPLALSDAG